MNFELRFYYFIIIFECLGDARELIEPNGSGKRQCDDREHLD